MSRPLAALLVPLEGDRLVGVSLIFSTEMYRWANQLLCVIAFADSGQVFCSPSYHVSQNTLCFGHACRTLYSYLGAEFPKVLEQPDVEYKQANLTRSCKSRFESTATSSRISFAATVASAFDPPAGKAPYSYVFDFSGEIRHDRTEMVRCIHSARNCSPLPKL